MGQQPDSSDRGIIQRTVTRKPRAGYHRHGMVGLRRENASVCVNSCFNELIPNVEAACRQLQRSEHQHALLWDLYCCDSVNCGVYIGNIGQSPNVDLIINECQNIGFFSIEDPGPPATNYCASSTPNTDSSPHVTAAATSSNVPIFRTFSAESIAHYTDPPAHTSETSGPLSPTPVISSSSTSFPNSADGKKSSGLPKGAKAAIGVCSVIAALAITTLVLLLLRKQRRNASNNLPGRPKIIPYGGSVYPGPHSGSRTPLITPPSSLSNSIPLAPPAKLSDRRYLQPMFKQGAVQPSASSSKSDQALPSSLVRPPAQSKLKSLRERRATTNSFRFPVNTTVIELPRHPQSSVYSVSSGPGASTVTVESIKPSSIHSGSATITGTNTPPLSPARFPQAHDGPHETSSCGTPSGPAPKRALPAPPPRHPNSPTFSLSRVSPRSPTFPSRSLNFGDSHVIPIPKSNSMAPALSASTRELCDLTESYARETRESWGSWSGVGGGGPGVTHTGRKRRSKSPRASAERTGEGRTAATPLELDLEKLSGRY
ncbi:hypothetical protein F4861DRAFT_159239 [Xylaria intraflava]|nr:hypothetical protein F4861DRAFT_159239 [Xylaria intraflava]